MMMHHGVDVGGRFPVTAAGDGIVKLVGKDWDPLSDKLKAIQSGGNTVLIDHDGIVTAYYHGGHQTALVVGDRVKRGDFIYMSGSTGLSTANHLHFETRRANGRMGNTLDPETLLKEEGPDAGMEYETVGKTGLDSDTWKLWQTALKGFGLYSGEIDGIPGRLSYTAIQRWADAPETGKLDDNTKKAVQRRLGVEPDGIWGPTTIGELKKELAQGLAGPRAPAPAPRPAPTPTPTPEPKPAPAPIPELPPIPEVKPIPKFKPMSDKLKAFFKMRKDLRGSRFPRRRRHY